MPGDTVQFVCISAKQRPVLVTSKNWSVKRPVGPVTKRELLADISTKTTEIFGQMKHPGINVNTHEGTNPWDSSQGPKTSCRRDHSLVPETSPLMRALKTLIPATQGCNGSSLVKVWTL